MNSQDDFPLDSFGIEPTKHQPHSQARHKRELADLVSTVIALDHSRPLRPQPQSLQSIVDKIASPPTPSLKQRYFAWSGWAAAAAVTLLFVIQKKSPSENPPALTTHSLPPSTTIARDPGETSPPHDRPTSPTSPASPPKDHQAQSHALALEAANMREQQRSLIQEIETLRKSVALLASRDKQRLVAQNGVSWPIIMKLTAPGSDPLAAVVKDPVIAAMFETNPLATAGTPAPGNLDSASRSTTVTPDPSLPSAVPIYDPARDSGQLVINNLKAPADGQAYYLWVQSDHTNQPVLVGSLPENFASSESFHFQLGSVGIIPDHFVITQDPLNSPSTPSTTNTILLGPE